MSRPGIDGGKRAPMVLTDETDLILARIALGVQTATGVSLPRVQTLHHLILVTNEKDAVRQIAAKVRR